MFRLFDKLDLQSYLIELVVVLVTLVMMFWGIFSFVSGGMSIVVSGLSAFSKRYRVHK